jgi:hypothetical protein
MAYLAGDHGAVRARVLEGEIMAEAALKVSQDFVRDRRASLLIWGLPALVMLGTGLLGLGSPVHGLIWASCLSIFGFGCIANARRCSRLHCFFTGPFFLLMALISLVHDFGVISLGSHGWARIGGVTLMGAIALTILPERIWGQYVGGDAPEAGGGCC